MKFLTHADGAKLPSGTYRVGSIQASLVDLIQAFGQPERETGAEDKRFFRWVLLFADGSHAELYDYTGANELAVGNCTWSIGGLSRNAADNLHGAFRDYLRTRATVFPPLAHPAPWPWGDKRVPDPKKFETGAAASWDKA